MKNQDLKNYFLAIHNDENWIPNFILFFLALFWNALELGYHR